MRFQFIEETSAYIGINLTFAHTCFIAPKKLDKSSSLSYTCSNKVLGNMIPVNVARRDPSRTLTSAAPRCGPEELCGRERRALKQEEYEMRIR